MIVIVKKHTHTIVPDTSYSAPSPAPNKIYHRLLVYMLCLVNYKVIVVELSRIKTCSGDTDLYRSSLCACVLVCVHAHSQMMIIKVGVCVCVLSDNYQKENTTIYMAAPLYNKLFIYFSLW